MALTLKQGSAYLFTLLSYAQKQSIGNNISEIDLIDYKDRNVLWSELNSKLSTVTKNLSRQMYNCMPTQNQTGRD